jgi:hypothetical protein
VLELKNKSLLCKWLFKFLNEDGVWQELLTNKYLYSKSLSQVTSQASDSPFWKGLMKVKEEFFARGSFIVGNGESVRFWEDIWLGDRPLFVQYLSLINIARHKNVSAASVLAQVPLNIEFRCALTGTRWDRWLSRLHKLVDVHPSDTSDLFRWKLVPSGVYSVKSMYLDLLNDNTGYLPKYLWKMKVSLKIKIFMWFVHQKEILTKDNLVKRNWQGISKCCFCDHEEIVQHLFIECSFTKIVWSIIRLAFNLTSPLNIRNLFGNWLNRVSKSKKINLRVGTCAILWAIWHVRNEFIFNKPCFPLFLQVIPLAIHWIRMWSYLQPAERHMDTDIGCNRLAMVARDIYSRFEWRFDRRITA